MAKYPFLREAASLIEEQGISLGDLATGEYPKVAERALARIRDSLERREMATDLKDVENEVLSYALALALVYSAKSDWLTYRFATAECERCGGLLAMESDSKLEEMARSHFGWRVEKTVPPMGSNFRFRIDVADYLRVAPAFHADGWKLVNRHLSGGTVYLKGGQLARLMAEALKTEIIRRASEEGVRNFVLPDALKPLRDEILRRVEEKKREYGEEMPLGLVKDAMPPCLSAVLADLAAGKNLSHMARFAVTAFLINVGEDVDDVLKLFENVADFDAGRARYQVDHIAGNVGSRVKYKVPNCAVMKSSGLCTNGGGLCSSIKSPMVYYRKRLRSAKGVPGGRVGTAAGTGGGGAGTGVTRGQGRPRQGEGEEGGRGEAPGGSGRA